ncbi:MAG: sugar ABC transporter permease [Clostridia bacterium]|nr:sugar ABC transporter permease [Clostridia bacterium]
MIIKAAKPELYRTVIQNTKKNMMLVALVLITNIFVVITDYKLLLPANVSNVINQNAYIIILACGMLLCIVCSANIDLSVGRLMGFIAACAAKFMIEGRMPVYLAVPLCLLIGIVVGAWQGFWISYMRIPAFVVTLAGQLIFYGLTMMILQGLTINNFPIAFKTMFSSYLPDITAPLFGPLCTALGIDIAKFNTLTMFIGILAVIGFIALQVWTRIRRITKKYPVESMPAFLTKLVIISGVLLWLAYCLAAASGLPTALFSVAIVLIIYLFLTSKTVPGRHLYAMGGNVNAARLSGVKTQKMLFLAYVNMGLLAALAGLVYAARLDAASPQAGQGDELYAIASCYIGGASAYGGIGTVGGALIGAMTMGVIKNGMSINSMGQDVQQIVLGTVLLAAVVVDIVSKNGVSFGNFFHFRKGGKKKASTAVSAA